VRLKEYGGGLEQGLVKLNLVSVLVMFVSLNCHCIVSGRQGLESRTALMVRSVVKSGWTRIVPSSLSEEAPELVERSDSKTGGPAQESNRSHYQQ